MECESISLENAEYCDDSIELEFARNIVGGAGTRGVVSNAWLCFGQNIMSENVVFVDMEAGQMI